MSALLQGDDIVVDHTEHQRDADPQRESHGHAGDGCGRRQEDVGRIEDHAAEQDPAETGSGSLSQVLEEGTSLRTEAAQGEGEQQRKDDHADHIVPIEQFIPPALGGQFLGIAPGTPAEHRDKAQDDRERVAIDNKHNVLILNYFRLFTQE